MKGTFPSAFLQLSLALLLSLVAVSAATPEDNAARDEVPSVPPGVAASADPPETGKSANVLKGKAEMSAVRSAKERSIMAWQASQLYKQGVAALDARNFKAAADCFKMAGVGFDQPGWEKFAAQTKFAEAQSRKLLGQAKEAAKLYQAAIDLFNEFDPLSPYLKGAYDELAKVAPDLKGTVERDKLRLQALRMPNRIMRVERNVMLRSGLSKYGARLLSQKALVDVSRDYTEEVVHKAFVRMTCLETAELGSNYYTAGNRWYPLIANGKTVAIAASSDFMVPTISVKINERHYNVGVDLPGLGPNKRTVFLLTDGSHIIAIDPATEDMWNLDGDFKQEPAKFSWRKFTHFKPKRKD